MLRRPKTSKLHRVRAAIFTSDMSDSMRTRSHAHFLGWGLHCFKGNFVTDLEIESRASHVVFAPKPMQRRDVFAAYSVVRRGGVSLAHFKAALQHVHNPGEAWQEMFDTAAKTFAETHDMSSYSVVATAQPAGHKAPPLAGYVLASLEPFIVPGTRIVRRGFAKDNLDGIHVDYELVERLAPARKAIIKASFDSAMRASEQAGRFLIDQMEPQFQKFVSGMVRSDIADLNSLSGNVLFIEDLYTPDCAFNQIKATLPPGVQPECFALLAAPNCLPRVRKTPRP